MGAEGIRDLSRRIDDALQLRHPRLGLRSLRRLNAIRVELGLQLRAEAFRFFLRLEAGTIDRAMAGLAAIDARHRHVVHVDEEIAEDDLIDLFIDMNYMSV